MTTYLYRFRPIKKLIEYKELEETYIYFASPEELNDPLEGFRPVVWTGDEIAWRNLFKHFFLCMYKMALQLLNNEKLSDECFPALASIQDLSEEELPAVVKYMSAFLSNENVIFHITWLSAKHREVDEIELKLHLSAVQMFALKKITQTVIQLNFLSDMQKITELSDSDTLKVSSKVREYLGDPQHLLSEDFKDHIARALALVEINDFIRSYNSWKDVGTKDIEWYRLSAGFSSGYIRNIKKLCVYNWYVACFMDSAENSSIWGTYGNNHTGVCLIYETNADHGKPMLELAQMQGSSKGRGKYFFKKVRYDEHPPVLKFFTSLARYSIPQLYNDWFLSVDGKSSSLAASAFKNEEAWRDSHFTDHETSVTTKLEAWRGEAEYRLTLTSPMNNHGDKQSRKLTYDFKKLHGIIFGINTTQEEKFQLVSIVEKLCDLYKKKGFVFYQAYHSVLSGKIERHQLFIVSASDDTP